MYAVGMIVTFNVMLYTYFTNGQSVALSFNTSVYGGTNDYYAHIGENVTLTCTVPTHRVAYMYKGSIFSEYEILVEYGEPMEEVTQQKDKYSFQSNDGSSTVTIHNLRNDDSSYYRCSSCRVLPGSYRCGWPLSVYLNVKELTDDSQTPDFCELVNNTDGIFFTGNDLILRCPQLSLNFETSNRSLEFSDDLEIEDHGSTFKLLTVSDLTSDLNGTMLSCFSVQDGPGGLGKDYCRYVPTILVFNNITIRISGGERPVINGENVTFTCHSHPFLPLTIQWDILDSNVRYENISISEIDQGSKITFNNVKFLDSFPSLLTVFCNVTIGSKISFQKTSAYLTILDAATTHVTSGVSKKGLTNFITSTTPFMKPSTYVSPAIIVISKAVAFIALGFVIVGLILIKVRKSKKKEELDRKKFNMQQDVKTLDESSYYTVMNNETEKRQVEGSSYYNVVKNETELGLEKHCTAHEKERRQVEGTSCYNAGSNETTIELESHTAAQIPSDGVYERSLPATYI